MFTTGFPYIKYYQSHRQTFVKIECDVVRKPHILNIVLGRA